MCAFWAHQIWNIIIVEVLWNFCCILETAVVEGFLLHLVYVKECAYSVCLFVTPWTVAHQAPLSLGILQARNWSGLLCPPPGDLPDREIEPRSPAFQADTLLSEPPGSPCERLPELITYLISLPLLCNVLFSFYSVIRKHWEMIIVITPALLSWLRSGSYWAHHQVISIF